jgi:glycosyltransferase involved in cell wall biosynthesis
LRRKKLLFLASEGWFIRSHFLALVERGVREGYDVVVAARLGDSAEAIQSVGARVIDLPNQRGAFGAFALLRARNSIARVLRAEQPDLLHVFSLKSIVLASLSARAAPGAIPLLAVTGLGFLATSRTPFAMLARNVLAGLISRRLRFGNARLVLENEDDLVWLEKFGRIDPSRITVLPGAGVEPDKYTPSPQPDGPLRIGLVARLVRSKGVDVAVEALALLRRSCPDAQLWIAGEADSENPAHYLDNEIAAWRAEPGVVLVGKIDDVPAFWAGMNVACLPSRGGEGLPRSLIEASACARPVVTTTVPGCRQFVVDGETGFLCPPNDVGALAEALLRLNDATLRRKLGDAGRRRVLEGYTTQHVADIVAKLWREAAP